MGSDSKTIKPLKGYFSDTQWLVFFCVLIVGLILRWASLDVKPFHHDESIYSVFSKNFLEHPGFHFFKNDPTYHGPFLYNLQRVVFEIFGVNSWAARAPMALLGSLFILLPLVFRRFFSSSATLVLATVIALSPTLIYWSRFVLHDFFVLSAVFLMLYALVLAPVRFRSLLFLTGLALHFVIKANVYVHLAIFVGYIVFEAGCQFYIKRSGRKWSGDGETLVQRAAVYVGRNPAQLFMAAIFALLVFSYFATSGFRYMEGVTQPLWAILSGEWPRTIEYWLGQHEIERIGGPFIYHFYVLSWYELPFILALLYYFIIFYSTQGKNVLLISLPVFIVGAFLAAYHFTTPVVDVALWNFFKLKNPMDVFFLFLIFTHALVVTTVHFFRGERALALTAYAFMATFFTYSYLGEKTPWLSMYPFVAGLPYLTLYFDRLFRSEHKQKAFNILMLMPGLLLFLAGIVFVVQEGVGFNWIYVLAALVLCLLGYGGAKLKSAPHLAAVSLFILFVSYNLHSSFNTNFLLAGKAKEIISQVHTTQEFHDLALNIRAEVKARPLNDPARIMILGNATWPLTWYFRDVPLVQYHRGEESIHLFDYVFHNPESPLETGESFESRTVPLRGWFVPNYSQMTLKRFLSYSFFREPWNESGYQSVVLQIRKE